MCIRDSIFESKINKLLRKSSQFEIGLAAGPESMIALVKFVRNILPHPTFIALDICNAFGEISRTEVLKVVIEELPEFAPFLVNLADEAGSWSTLSLFDGLFQGHIPKHLFEVSSYRFLFENRKMCHCCLSLI